MFSAKTATGRLMLVLLATGLLLLCLSGVSLYSIATLGTTSEQVAHVFARQAEIAGTINASLAGMVASSRGLVMQSILGNQESAQRFRQQEAEIANRLEASLREYDRLLSHSADRRKLQELRDQIGAIRQASEKVNGALVGQRMDEALNVQSEKLLPLQMQAMQQVQEFVDAQHKRMALAADQASAAALTGKTLIAIFVLLGIVAITSLVVVGRKFVMMFQRMASNLAAESRRVSEVSEQVSSASRALAEGATEQAASLDQTTSSMDQITGTIQQNAQHSRQASEYAEHAGSTMLELNEKFQSMTAVMHEINASSEKISKIIKVIDEIAFQTNILALNAAVEAARAGDVGMGFAVVADAVRNLAQRSATAAKDTEDLIDESIRNAREGRKQTDLVAQAMGEVTGHAQKVKELAGNVTRSSAEQAQRVDEIARVLHQMRVVTQRTASHAEESAAAGEEMASVSVNLRESATRFQEMVGSSS
jgi:methyl-accepting chemotaxis protein/methyl-accepting chemotaxis protein-1 (serine sensor receptor)